MMSLDLDSWDQGRWRQEGRSALWSKTVGLKGLYSSLFLFIFISSYNEMLK